MELDVLCFLPWLSWAHFRFSNAWNSLTSGQEHNVWVFIFLIRSQGKIGLCRWFNTRNKLLTQKLLKQGYLYHKLRKIFSKFYRRYYDLISKFQIGLKSLLCQGLSEPDFYGDLVYKLKKIVGSNNFSGQFIK